jgi:DNA-binding GntR family transcriptional regulator
MRVDTASALDDITLTDQTVTSKFDRLRKPSENRGLATEAYMTVRDRIVRGELAIGQVISRRKVAAELGMSFLPVTEALIRLENEGLLESRPRVGTRVRVPTREDVEGHYVVREALEVQAAMLFAQRAERDERTELMKLAKRVDALSAQSDGDRFVYAALHEKLHRYIAEFARCSALSYAISRTSAIASTWLCATRASSRANPPNHHQNLMKVLVNDSPAAASDAMRSHIRFSLENALRRLERYFEMQDQAPEAIVSKSNRLVDLSDLSEVARQF